MLVLHEIVGNVLVLRIENPSVNALSQTVRQGLLDGIARGAQDDVRAILISGGDKVFVAGADIREFDLPPQPPHLPDVMAAIEASDKPVVAAVAGQALGGGLELALACHYRFATSTARFGLPETTLGVVPGAGGTQRLPRLIDPLVAAEMIATGASKTASEALALGLIDGILEGPVEASAIARIQGILDQDLEPRRLCWRQARASETQLASLSKLRAETKRKSRGALAPVVAVDLVMVALAEPCAVGLAKERSHFLELRAGPQAAALRHIFFAERKAAKATDEPVQLIERVGVVGGGTMGAGIAMSVSDAGIPVILVEQNEEALRAGLSRIWGAYEAAADRGRLAAEVAAQRIARITGTTDYERLGDANLIIEAAFETMEVKESIFSRLDNVAHPDAILATNTSYLDLDAIAAVTRRPESVVGLHYFSPANVMKLLEIVRGRATQGKVMATAIAFARRTGKIPVVAGVCHGFIGNRMLRAYNREAGLLLIEGASPSQVDRALTNFGMAMGPLAVADLSGIDIGHKGRLTMAPGEYEPAAFAVHDRLVELGMLGRKTGFGFYDYSNDASGCENPVVRDIVTSVQTEYGIDPRSVDDSEIVERCIFAAAAEGLQIVAEGVANSTGDVDVVFVNGYGFPRHCGGPIYHLMATGLSALHSVTRYSEGRFGHWWPLVRVQSQFDSAAISHEAGLQRVV